MLALLAMAALASDPAPVVATGDDGTVTATIHLEAAPDQVRTALADPVAAAHLTPEVLDIHALPTDGGCVLMDVQTTGLWNPMCYRARRCPTASGWRVDLVSSDSFESMHSEWKLVPSASGTDVTLTVHSEIGSIPDALVEKGTEKSLKNTLLALVKQVAGL
jgi:hypothetical protein